MSPYNCLRCRHEFHSHFACEISNIDMDFRLDTFLFLPSWTQCYEFISIFFSSLCLIYVLHDNLQSDLESRSPPVLYLKKAVGISRLKLSSILISIFVSPSFCFTFYTISKPDFLSPPPFSFVFSHLLILLLNLSFTPTTSITTLDNHHRKQILAFQVIQRE